MKEQDRREFQQYLNDCTDRQVHDVLEKEQTSGRKDYAELAKEELKRRGQGHDAKTLRPCR